MLRIAVLVLAASMLSACGKSESKQAQVVIEKAIYMSAADCGEGGKVKPDMCSALIDKAIQMHEAQSQTFKSLASCEAASGPERCEKAANGQYRMRLQAFMFEIAGPQAQASPLYPSIEGKVGFRDAKKKAVDATDENITISQACLTLAHENSKIGKKSRS